MRKGLLTVAAMPLLITTGCGSHSVASQSKAAMVAMSRCQSRFYHQFHLRGGSKAISEGFVHDLGNGRYRLTGTVPAEAGLDHPQTYTCVVAPGSSGPHIVWFDTRRAG